MRWPELTRIAAAAGALIAALAACADTPKPFQPDAKIDAALAVPPGAHPVSEEPEFVIAPPVGPRPEMANKIATSLALALRNYGIVATPAPARALKRISATVATRDAGEDVQIDITWTVHDEGGKRIGGNDQRLIGRPRDWFEADDRLISRIATQAAFRIGRQLGRGDLANVPIDALPDALGPATLPPLPASSADPGPASGNPPTPTTPPDYPGAPSPPPSVTPPAPPATTPSPPPTTPAPVLTAASNAPRVRVLAVTGVPEASKAMTSAMRRALGESQMVLVDRAESDAFQIQGTVELAPPVEGRQRVVIRWVIRRGDGTQIGDLEQANTVRAGSLDGNWERLAPIVALAASDGIADLIARDRNKGGSR
ncbi:hypothetical protein [Reyranella sp. CPCC 100927]|uniref:hypothetical protein n=1 Tax=Reyranella sp. CPCC 100927 TaxID=2599616 RepID=UPI0015B3D50F|nr:hypothetical protein [Reyranella sp. CPCC 100927]